MSLSIVVNNLKRKKKKKNFSHAYISVNIRLRWEVPNGKFTRKAFVSHAGEWPCTLYLALAIHSSLNDSSSGFGKRKFFFTRSMCPSSQLDSNRARQVYMGGQLVYTFGIWFWHIATSIIDLACGTNLSCERYEKNRYDTDGSDPKSSWCYHFLVDCRRDVLNFVHDALLACGPLPRVPSGIYSCMTPIFLLFLSSFSSVRFRFDSKRWRVQNDKRKVVRLKETV